MLVPKNGHDDLGQMAEANSTFLRYRVDIAYRGSVKDGIRPRLEITHEELDYIRVGDAQDHLLFEPSKQWLKSVVQNKRTSKFISTELVGDEATVQLHQEGNQGRPRSFRAATLPRTVLSTVNAAESPTALLARREMQSWRVLQLEPTSLRSPDLFTAPTMVDTDGSHLPATLYHLNQTRGRDAHKDSVYAQIGNTLATLVDDVKSVYVERDEKQDLFTLHVVGMDGHPHPARALSDGTLRFLALATIEADARAQGVICLEEPENGIHPERIDAMLSLLQDLAVDITEPIGDDNPLRQVIINTHSPTVVALVPEDSVLFADRLSYVHGGRHASRVGFRFLARTWRDRTRGSASPVQKGAVLAFLNPVRTAANNRRGEFHGDDRSRPVFRRDDIGQYALAFDELR